MIPEYEQILVRAELQKEENRKFLTKLKKKKPKNLDLLIHGLHEEVFEEIDCLQCANCCKSLGPRILEKDIERMSKPLKKKPADVISSYLRIDEDGDYVFKSMPCPFLLADNYCMIYEHRPKACREYPHTDRRKFHQILDLTFKNTTVCPAVVEIVERVKSEI
jgi:uncharacterized protein